MHHNHEHRYGFIGWIICTFCTEVLIAIGAE